MRDRLFRGVLIVAILTTIATSAPESHVVAEAQETALEANTVKRVRVVFSAAANEQAGSMTVKFADGIGVPIMIVPDDPALPAVELISSHTYDVLEVCVEAGPCELAFSIDPGPAGELTIEVEGAMGRGGDPSFCRPDNREFTDDATIEVIFE